MIHCKNCETHFKGNFCPQCGQSVYEYQKPFKFLVIDFVGNIFAFDTRFWKSLISLIIRPGKFTANYVKGQRASYTPPFRLYIFTSFVFFLISSIYINKTVELNKTDREEINTVLNQQINSNIKENDTDSLELKNLNNTFNEKEPFGLNSKETDTLNSNIIDFKTDVKSKKFIKTLFVVLDNPSLYVNRYMKFFSWSLFLLMPIYACFMWLFFYKSRRYYYSHFIFAINQHTFIFLICIVMLSATLLAPERSIYPERVLGYTIPIYLYVGYLQFYNKEWFKTLIRLISVVFFYALTMILTLGIILVFLIQDTFM